MLPAHQPLEPDHHVVLGPHHRLVVQLQLVGGERLAQVVEQQRRSSSSSLRSEE
jgi:hypothetical protein